jgi:hypothetical protein
MGLGPLLYQKKHSQKYVSINQTFFKNVSCIYFNINKKISVIQTFLREENVIYLNYSPK